MKILVTSLFMLFNFCLLAQNDTIFTKNGKVIICEITVINGRQVFYKEKGNEIESIELSKVNHYVKNGNNISSVDESALLIKGKTKYTPPFATDTIARREITKMKFSLEKNNTAFILSGVLLVAGGFISLIEATNKAPTNYTSTQYSQELTTYNNNQKNLRIASSACNLAAGLTLFIGVTFHFGSH
ncbi:MAG: hypothetical protein WCP52_00135 [Bacteroidota bacterium]